MTVVMTAANCPVDHLQGEDSVRSRVADPLRAGLRPQHRHRGRQPPTHVQQVEHQRASAEHRGQTHVKKTTKEQNQ